MQIKVHSYSRCFSVRASRLWLSIFYAFSYSAKTGRGTFHTLKKTCFFIVILTKLGNLLCDEWLLIHTDSTALVIWLVSITNCCLCPSKDLSTCSLWYNEKLRGAFYVDYKIVPYFIINLKGSLSNIILTNIILNKYFFSVQYK